MEYTWLAYAITRNEDGTFQSGEITFSSNSGFTSSEVNLILDRLVASGTKIFVNPENKQRVFEIRTATTDEEKAKFKE